MYDTIIIDFKYLIAIDLHVFADLGSVVPFKEIQELSTKHNMKYFETSALKHGGLKTCFDGAVSRTYIYF